FRRQVPQRLHVEVGRDYRPSPAEQAQGRRPADAARCAGDHRFPGLVHRVRSSSLNFRTFPVAVFGSASASMTTTSLGTLKRARPFLHAWMILSGSMRAPGAGTT